MGLGFDSTLVLGPQASPGPQFPHLEKGVNYPCLSISWGCKKKMIDLKEAGSSVCMFRTKVKRRDQGGGYGDGPGRKVAGRVWDLKWMDSEI